MDVHLHNLNVNSLIFGLTLVDKLRCIVLVPTRELSLQVYQVFKKFQGSKSSDIKSFQILRQFRVSCAVSETSFTESTSKTILLSSVDVIIFTPSKLYNFHHNIRSAGLANYNSVKWIVIDEADRLLKQRYQEWLSVINCISKERMLYITSKTDISVNFHLEDLKTNSLKLQKLLFSATMTQNPQKIYSIGLNRPIFFLPSTKDVLRTPTTLRELFTVCNNKYRALYLLQIILRLSLGENMIPRITKMIVFCNSRDNAHRLTRLLQICLKSNLFDRLRSQWFECINRTVENDKEINFFIYEFSSNLNKKKRASTIKKFSSLLFNIGKFEPKDVFQNCMKSELKNSGNKSCEFRILISSDLCSRGLDISNVQYVINYDFPDSYKTYLHRCGRTARAGNIGSAYTLVANKEFEHFKTTILDDKRRLDDWKRVVQEHKISLSEMTYLVNMHEDILEKLNSCITKELQGKMSATEDILSN